MARWSGVLAVMFVLVVSSLAFARGDVIVGTNGPDHLRGGNGPDVIRGLGGNDRLGGGNGPDAVYGGRGNDRIFTGKGGSGKGDAGYGGPGNDRISNWASGHTAGVTVGGKGFDICTVNQRDVDAGTVRGCEVIHIWR